MAVVLLNSLYLAGFPGIRFIKKSKEVVSMFAITKVKQSTENKYD